MRRFALAAAVLLLAAGCASNPYGSMGYAVVDDGEYGCAFYYGSSYYYQGGVGTAARMQIVRVERVRIPRVIDRGDASQAGGANIRSSDGPAGVAGGVSTVDRAPVSPPAPHAPPQAVGPRN